MARSNFTIKNTMDITHLNPRITPSQVVQCKKCGSIFSATSSATHCPNCNKIYEINDTANIDYPE